MDSSSGVVTPYFDFDTKIVWCRKRRASLLLVLNKQPIPYLSQLYLAGKGDGNIRYYEIVDEAPYIYYLNQFLSGQPQVSLRRS